MNQQEAAARLGCSVKTMYIRLKRNLLPYRMSGRRYEIAEDELLAAARHHGWRIDGRPVGPVGLPRGGTAASSTLPVTLLEELRDVLCANQTPHVQEQLAALMAQIAEQDRVTHVREEELRSQVAALRQYVTVLEKRQDRQDGRWRVVTRIRDEHEVMRMQINGLEEEARRRDVHRWEDHVQAYQAAVRKRRMVQRDPGVSRGTS